MKIFEKGRKQIVVFLVIYVIISIIVGLSAFKYLAPKFISPNTEIGLYALFSIAAAISTYIYTKRRFTQASDIEMSFDFLSEQERKEKMQKQKEKEEKELKKKRAEEIKMHITDKIEEIIEGLNEENNPEKYFDNLLINLSKAIMIVQGVAYVLNKETNKYSIISTYAYYTTDTSRTFELGEGIPGQVAKDQKLLFIDGVPEGYIKIVSGLGSSSPKYMGVIPFIHDGVTLAILEIATFEKPQIDFDEFHKQFNAKVSDKIASLVEA